MFWQKERGKVARRQSERLTGGKESARQKERKEHAKGKGKGIKKEWRVSGRRKEGEQTEVIRLGRHKEGEGHTNGEEWTEGKGRGRQNDNVQCRCTPVKQANKKKERQRSEEYIVSLHQD